VSAPAWSELEALFHEARGALDVLAMTTHAPLEPGTRRGVYEIAGRLGAGGMGEVYRARDTTLRRDVAIKILPSAFVADADRAGRLEREARVLAALNHPHIAAIYGFEQGALILELVEGETLADRIARGPVPITETLAIARQIAEAFEAAHEKGIVHRDLKPANIKITPEGTATVLDFGLAKAMCSCCLPAVG
jgi:serine/threonine protein kinase